MEGVHVAAADREVVGNTCLLRRQVSPVVEVLGTRAACPFSRCDREANRASAERSETSKVRQAGTQALWLGYWENGLFNVESKDALKLTGTLAHRAWKQVRWLCNLDHRMLAEAGRFGKEDNR